MSVMPKKTNLFKFFKSDDFNRGRVLICAIYILLSHVNEMMETVCVLLKGYEGVLIGNLKRKAKEATAAFDTFVKEYENHIDGGLGQLADATIDATSAIDITVEQNKFFLQQGYNAIHATIAEQLDKTINDKEQLEKEQFAGFEIFDQASRKETLESTIRQTKARLAGDPNLDKVLEGVRIGFNVACDYVNEVYLKS